MVLSKKKCEKSCFFFYIIYRLMPEWGAGLLEIEVGKIVIFVPVQ